MGGVRTGTAVTARTTGVKEMPYVGAGTRGFDLRHRTNHRHRGESYQAFSRGHWDHYGLNWALQGFPRKEVSITSTLGGEPPTSFELEVPRPAPT